MTSDSPIFRICYDFRRKLRLEDYASFYAEHLEEFKEGEKLGFLNVWLPEAVRSW